MVCWRSATKKRCTGCLVMKGGVSYLSVWFVDVGRKMQGFKRRGAGARGA